MPHGPYSHEEVLRRQRIAKRIGCVVAVVFVGLTVWGGQSLAAHPTLVDTTTTTTFHAGASRCVYEGTCDPGAGDEAPQGDSHGWDY